MTLKIRLFFFFKHIQLVIRVPRLWDLGFGSFPLVWKRCTWQKEKLHDISRHFLPSSQSDARESVLQFDWPARNFASWGKAPRSKSHRVRYRKITIHKIQNFGDCAPATLLSSAHDIIFLLLCTPLFPFALRVLISSNARPPSRPGCTSLVI